MNQNEEISFEIAVKVGCFVLGICLGLLLLKSGFTL